MVLTARSFFFVSVLALLSKYSKLGYEENNPEVMLFDKQ